MLTADVARGNLALLIGQSVTGSLEYYRSTGVGGYESATPVGAEGTLALAAATSDARTAEVAKDPMPPNVSDGFVSAIGCVPMAIAAPAPKCKSH